VQKTIPSKGTIKNNKCKKLVTSYLQMKKQKQNQQIEMQQEKERSET
jgi:stalled ribosome alternative rescue factor ArfA